MRLYIAGPMTNYPQFNRAAFARAADALTEAGFVVCDPAVTEEDGWTHVDYVRYALRQMLTCDGVATLPYWQESWGADIEVRTAHSVLLPVLPLHQWVERGPLPTIEKRAA